MTPEKQKSLQDFPEYVDAAARLADLESELSFAQRDLQAAEKNPSDHAALAEGEAVRALLSGGTAVAAPSLADLQQSVRIYARAVAEMRRELEAIAQRIEASETATSEREFDDEDSVGVIEHLQAAISLSERQAERRASVRRRFNGHCSLPMLSLSGDFLQRVRQALQQYRDGAKHLGVVE